jgi:pre-mRNA-processing factor 19
LSQTRRSKKKPPVEFASLDSIKGYTKVSDVPSLHTSRSPGIVSFDVDHSGNRIVTGGNDKHVQIYDKTENKVIANMTGHTKKITCVKFRGQAVENDVAISASVDKHVRIWAADESNSKWGYLLLCVCVLMVSLFSL